MVQLGNQMDYSLSHCILSVTMFENEGISLFLSSLIVMILFSSLHAVSLRL